MLKKWLFSACTAELAFSMFAASMPMQTLAQTLDRTRLPIAEPGHQPSTVLDVRKATAPPFFDLKAPAGAPNVVLVLLDDMGFGQPDAFGGGINMPMLDWLSTEGLRYSNFHTTALMFADAGRSANGTQSSHQQYGCGSGYCNGFSGQHRQAASQRSPAGRDPAAQRLQHGRFRQVASDAALGNERLRTVHAVADKFGF